MPTLHRYVDRPGFYARGVTKGQPVAFGLSAEGEQYLTETLGLSDGAKFAGDTLKWLYRKGWAIALDALPEGPPTAVEEAPAEAPAGPALEGVIQVRLGAQDHVLLDQSAAEVARGLARTGASVLGPLPLPVVVESYRVLREGSPKAYEVRTYRRLLQVRAARRQTVEMMSDFKLPREIDLQVEMTPGGR
jgi:small subunit ribosomal protein S10